MVEPVKVGPGGQAVADCGVATLHPTDHVAEWTVPDRYILMLFRTPFVAETVNGRERGQAGQMLLTGPGSHQWHRGTAGQGFCNDWIHMSAGAAASTVEQADLPHNRIFSVSDPPALRHIFTEIQREFLGSAPDRNEVLACLVTELILMTRRYYRLAAHLTPSRQMMHARYDQLCTIRIRLNDELAAAWTVETMAKLANLSPNRFAVLYKKFFDVSPIDDLITMRLDEAKRLLSQSNTVLTAIAEHCGFSSVYYFCRVFKARTGLTPTQYRS